MKEQIDLWLKNEVIEEGTSEWNAALIPVLKDVKRIRWCLDFRGLNALTLVDSYPIGSCDDNINRLAHSSIFSTLDGEGAFHQVEVAPEDRHKTAFSTPFALQIFSW